LKNEFGVKNEQVVNENEPFIYLDVQILEILLNACGGYPGFIKDY